MAVRDMCTYLIQTATDFPQEQLLLFTWYVDENTDNAT